MCYNVCRFVCECYVDHRDLHVLTHSFPTRRSSDLRADRARRPVDLHLPEMPAVMRYNSRKPIDQTGRHRYARTLRAGSGLPEPAVRSEEHTSELQSLMRISYAVFCLKKKNVEYTHKTPAEHTKNT